MTRWLLRRTLQALVTLAVAVALAFVLMRAAPGDPIGRIAVQRTLSPSEVHELRILYGLDQPWLAQFTALVGGALRGQLGTSITYRQPVTAVLADRLPATVLLGGTVLLINFTLGLWLGARQAVRQGRVEDRLLTVLSLAGYAMPSFWIGLVLAWLVGVEWRLLPPAGMRDPLLDPAAGLVAHTLDLLRHLVLPAATLSLVSIAATMRHQRTAMLDVLDLPFVQTARAKGVTERRVIRRHVWRNALFPIITLFGLWLPLLVTGAVFVEAVFAWPGLGSMAADAVSSRDYPLLMGTSLLVSALVVLSGLLADVAYALLDPRVRYE